MHNIFIRIGQIDKRKTFFFSINFTIQMIISILIMYSPSLKGIPMIYQLVKAL